MEPVTHQAATLAVALVAAQRQARAVEKGGKFAGGSVKYNYASTESIIEEARDALSSNGLSVFPAMSKVAYMEGRPVLLSQYELLHSSGESRRVEYDTPIVEGAGRPLDKATATARTYALGYFLRDLLLLPRVEAGTDVSARDDSGHVPGPRAPRRDPIDALPADHVARELRSRFATDATKSDVVASWKEVGVAFKSKQLNGELLDALTFHRDAAAQRVKESEKREPGEEG